MLASRCQRFPNYDFVRALKQELEGDGGSIFRYATHENSTLVAIDRQLADSRPRIEPWASNDCNVSPSRARSVSESRKSAGPADGLSSMFIS